MINTTHFKLFNLDFKGDNARAFISPHVPFNDRDNYLRIRYANAAKPMSTAIMYNRWLEIMRPELRRGKPSLLRGRVQAFYAMCGTDKRRYNAIALGTLLQLTEGTVVTTHNQIEAVTYRYYDAIKPACLIAIFREIGKDYTTNELGEFVLSYNDIHELLQSPELSSVVDGLKSLEA